MTRETESQGPNRDTGETPGHMVPVSLSTFVTILQHAWTQAASMRAHKVTQRSHV
jgi:hypothetical protein